MGLVAWGFFALASHLVAAHGYSVATTEDYWSDY